MLWTRGNIKTESTLKLKNSINKGITHFLITQAIDYSDKDCHNVVITSKPNTLIYEIAKI